MSKPMTDRTFHLAMGLALRGEEWRAIALYLAERIANGQAASMPTSVSAVLRTALDTTEQRRKDAKPKRARRAVSRSAAPAAWLAAD